MRLAQGALLCPAAFILLILQQKTQKYVKYRVVRPNFQHFNASPSDEETDTISTPFDTKIPPRTISMRLDWMQNHVTSPLARLYQERMARCSSPRGVFWFRNRYGLGSDLVLWSQALCQGIFEYRGVRILTAMESWIFRHEPSCPEPSPSTLACYFPHAEHVCEHESKTSWKDYRTGGRLSASQNETATIELVHGIGNFNIDGCQATKAQYGGDTTVVGAGIEYLFGRGVSEVLMRKVEELHARVFAGQPTPPNLVAVHIRWGDKSKEMNLLPVDAYVKAVRGFFSESNGTKSAEQRHVFLATEDPDAVQAFEEAAPSHWKIYVDPFVNEYWEQRKEMGNRYNGNPLLSRAKNGEPGLLALASLLLTMEASDYVLTTASNWSMIMDMLRRHIVDPDCGNCTRMVDLRPLRPRKARYKENAP